MRKRLGIFAIYNGQGRIEKYVTYLLKELKKCCQTLIAVCNGYISEEGAGLLQDYADVVFQRENIGYDCGAIQDVLIHLYGWDKVLLHDELAIMNDTCYGPIYPLGDVFHKMDGSNADFWGITEQLPLPMDNVDREAWGMDVLPYHIQSYFMVFRKSLLHHPCFRNFWQGLALSDGYYGTVKGYELAMTPYFCGKGFRADAYIHEEAGTEGCYLYNQPYYLAMEKRLPFIKRKSAIFRPDDRCLPFFFALERGRLFSYLEENRLYDLSLIREDLAHRHGTQDADGHWDEKASVDELKAFRKNNATLMVYGAGLFAYLATQALKAEGIPLDGYVVSDGHRKEPEKNGIKIFELSELYGKREETGIILGMEKRICKEIIKNLDMLGFRNIFFRDKGFGRDCQ